MLLGFDFLEVYHKGIAHQLEENGVNFSRLFRLDDRSARHIRRVANIFKVNWLMTTNLVRSTQASA